MAYVFHLNTASSSVYYFQHLYILWREKLQFHRGGTGSTLLEKLSHVEEMCQLQTGSLLSYILATLTTKNNSVFVKLSFEILTNR